MNNVEQNTGVTVHWAGLDVSKDSFDVGLLLHGALGRTPALTSLPTARFARTPKGVACFVEWLDERCEGIEGELRCVMETTGRFSTELAMWLIEARPSLAPAIAHAKYAADFIKSLGVRTHTDALAARALALFGLLRQPKAYEPASKKERQLREVCRYRYTLVTQQTALKNRMKDVPESTFVKREERKRLRLLARDIKRAEVEMRARVDELPAVKEDVARFETIYGVGFITATVVRAEFGDLDRFEKARQITAHAGLNPTVRRSGTSVFKKTRMSKQGNKRVRQALYMAARSAIRGDNDFAQDYRRLVERGLKPKAALGAIMRKILVVMRALTIRRETYDPKRKSSGKLGGKLRAAPSLSGT